MEKQTKPKNKFEQLMERRPIQIAFGLLSLLLAYVFASWAIDSGSLLDYAITLLLIFVGVRELANVVIRKKR